MQGFLTPKKVHLNLSKKFTSHANSFACSSCDCVVALSRLNDENVEATNLLNSLCILGGGEAVDPRALDMDKDQKDLCERCHQLTASRHVRRRNTSCAEHVRRSGCDTF